jgi:hypothetical protein
MRGGNRTTTWTPETVKPGPGRPPGARDKIPRSVKASIRKIFEEIASTEPELIRAGIIAGLQAEPPKSFPYLQLAAAYVDGRPAENVKMEIGVRRLTISHRYADGTEYARLFEVGPVDQLTEGDELTLEGEVVAAPALPEAMPLRDTETL